MAENPLDPNQAELTPVGVPDIPTRPVLTFGDHFVPMLRRGKGLSAAVEGIVSVMDGPGVYEDLRNNAGMNDLEIIQRHIQLPKVDVPIESLRAEGLSKDDIIDSFLTDLYLDLDEDLLKAGISKDEFFATFVKGRELTPVEARLEGAGRGLVLGTGATAGMLAGGTLGMQTGNPIVAAFTGALGLIGGVVGAQEVEEVIFPSDPVLNDEALATIEAYKVLGEGATGMTLPFFGRKVANAAVKAAQPTLGEQAGFLNRLGRAIMTRPYNQKPNPLYGMEGVSDVVSSQKFLPVDEPALFKMFQSFNRSPQQSLMQESLGVAGASVGTNIAMRGDPDDPFARVAGEVGGGMLTQYLLGPLRFAPYIAAAKDTLNQDLMKLAEDTTASGAEQRVAFALVQLLQERGEDPQALLEGLRDPSFRNILGEAVDGYAKDTTRPLLQAQPGLDAPTSRAITNSATLELLEAKLRQTSRGTAGDNFDSRMQNAFDGQLEAIDNLIVALTVTGQDNPRAVQIAAGLRKEYFEDVVSKRFANALNRAEQTVQNINPNSADARVEASKKINDIIERAFVDVRAQEDLLYKAIPEKLRVGTDNLIGMVDEYEDLLPLELFQKKFPSIARAVAKRFRKEEPEPEPGTQEELFPTTLDTDEADEEVITFGQMDRLRQFFLAEARAAASGESPNSFNAKMFGDVANAIRLDMEDLPKLSEFNGEDLAADTVLALGKAKAYGSAMRDVFRRAFPNEALRDKRSGQDFIFPELLYKAVTRGGDDETRLRMDQMKSAVTFLATQLTPEAPFDLAQSAIRLNDLSDANEIIMRSLAASKIVKQGRIDLPALERFVRDNERTLDLLPGLKADLSNAASAETLLRRAQDRAETNFFENRFETEEIFERLTGEAPSTAIDIALSSPKRATRNILDLVEKVRADAAKTGRVSVEEVNRQLRDMFFINANAKAGGRTTFIGDTGAAPVERVAPDFGKMRSYFFESTAETPSLMNTLVKADLFTEAEKVRLNKVLKAAEAAQKRLSEGADLVEDLETPGDLLTGLLVKSTGASLGTKAAGLLPGGQSTLIAASGGSRAAQKLMEAIPVTTTNEILEKAIEDPDFLALLLEKGLLVEPKGGFSPKQLAKNLLNVRKLNVYLKNALGITGTELLGAEELTDEERAAMNRFEVSPFGTLRPRQLTPPGRPDSRAIMPRRQPTPTPPMPAPMPPPAQAAATPPTIDRQRFAALYPNDPVSALIEVQGIGALPQAPRV